MSKILKYMPELQGEEQLYVAQLMKEMTEEQAAQFAHVFRHRRKDAPVILLMSLVGLLGIAGIHRFYLGQVGMGLLYLLTGGLCAIGTIVDAFNHQNLTLPHNLKQAQESAMLVKAALPSGPAGQLPEAG